MEKVEINCVIGEVEDRSRRHELANGESVVTLHSAAFTLETVGAPPDGWDIPKLLGLIGRRVRLVVEEEPVGSVTATCGYVPPSMTVSFEGNTWVMAGPVPSPTEFIALSGGPLDRKTFYCPEGDALQIGPDIYRSIDRRLPSGERIFVHVGPSPVEALFHALASVPEAIEPPVNGPAAATEGSWLTRKSLF